MSPHMSKHIIITCLENNVLYHSRVIVSYTPFVNASCLVLMILFIPQGSHIMLPSGVRNGVKLLYYYMEESTLL